MITYRIDIQHNELYTIAEGTITLVDVRAHLRQERHDLALPYRELVDARNAVLALSPADVRDIVALLRDFSRSQRLGATAVVVSTNVAYGVMRMLETLIEDVCVVRPFRDLDRALTWLRTT